MNNNQVLNLIKKFIKSRYQMVIATSDDHLWTATLYYSTDDDLNIYFLSSPDTIHGRHIAINPSVAVNITDAPQYPTSKKKGVQIYGVAQQVIGKQKIVHALSLWKKTLNIKSEIYSYEGMIKKLISGKMYKITPQKLKFFNEELWQEGEEPMIDLTVKK